MAEIKRGSIVLDTSYNLIIPKNDAGPVSQNFMMDDVLSSRESNQVRGILEERWESYEQNLQRHLIPTSLVRPWYRPQFGIGMVRQMIADYYCLNTRMVVDKQALNGVNRVDQVRSLRTWRYNRRNFGDFVENMPLIEAVIEASEDGWDPEILTNIAFRGREGLMGAIPHLVPYLRVDRMATMRPNVIEKSTELKLLGIGFNILEKMHQAQRSTIGKVVHLDDDPIVIAELIEQDLGDGYFLTRTAEQIAMQPPKQQEIYAMLLAHRNPRLVVRDPRRSWREEVQEVLSK